MVSTSWPCRQACAAVLMPAVHLTNGGCAEKHCLAWAGMLELFHPCACLFPCMASTCSFGDMFLIGSEQHLCSSADVGCTALRFNVCRKMFIYQCTFIISIRPLGLTVSLSHWLLF